MKDVIRLFLSRHLRRLGGCISQFPLLFVILPCVLTALLGSGIALLKYERDIPYLIGHHSGKAMKYKNVMESMFPRNTSEFTDLMRITDASVTTGTFVVSKKGGNVFTLECLQELESLDRVIRDVTIEHDGNTIRYEDLCGKVYGHCFQGSVLRLLPDKTRLFAGDKMRIRYPLMMNELSFTYKEFFSGLGGVTVDKGGFVEEVKAIRVFYLMDTSNASKIPAIKEWIGAVVEKTKLRNFSSIVALQFSFLYLSTEIKEVGDFMKPLIPAVALIVGAFSFLSLMASSWISSKSWLGVAAVVSAGLSLLSSFGLLSYFGVPASDFHLGIPFLVLGTEVDDAYILIATWRTTSSSDSVKYRMEETFAEAGVSITITSLTNVISCCIGLISPFLAIKYFCIYGAVSLTFTYIFMITFFGACMTFDGFREKKLLNAITLRKCSSPNKSSSDGGKLKISDEMYAMKVFKDVFGRILAKLPVKIIIILLSIANISAGTWGLLHLEDGLDPSNIVSADSVTSRALSVYNHYFRTYWGPLMIAVNSTLDYSDPLVQESIEQMLQRFKDHPKVDNTHEISWLKFYKLFQSQPIAKFALRGYDLTVEKDFTRGLHEVFLRFAPARQFNYDIKFNENYTKIVASRFNLVFVDIRNSKEELETLRDMWMIAEESKLAVTIHCPYFPLIEQGAIIRRIVFQITWVTSLLIFAVFFAFIPNFLTALMVSISVICALVESIGYGALWGLRLDLITTSSLVICVGFSINYPSHMAYVFTTAKGETANEKMRDSLYRVGLPILQGSLSTILSCCLLLIRNSHINLAFAKLIYLIVLQTAFHAMFFLPVVLSVSYQLLSGANLKSCNTKS